ncbi:MAG: vancomycin resistance histidine kinase VanS [Oscillospiraceae bacterium]
MNKNKKTDFKKSISVHILSKFIITLTIYFVSVLLLFLIGIAFVSIFTWQGDEFIYSILKVIDNNKVLTLIILFTVGFVVVSVNYWIKTLGYLQTVATATEKIYNDKNSLIELPPELKKVENQMNQIKFNISESKQVAKEAEQRKNDLVVYLAHDLKTPLTSVIGYLTLLRDENQISNELREKYLSISLNKAERLEDLINEFFEITRFNLSNITLEFSRVNLTRMLEQLIYEFKPMLSENNLQCTLSMEKNIMIKCDANKMQRVFDNLLRNAVNYSFEDSGIDITVTQIDSGIKINFTNHGNTIPKEKLNHLFEQFYRLDTARTTKSGGAGLGLAIAKEIVELHKGTITAYSENEIISFDVMLPTL